MYRVRLGPYDRQGDAEKMRGDLQTNGLDSALVRVQR
jgi:cell division protein FtsN